MNSNVILLIGRILLSIIFIVAGYGKLTGGAADIAGMLGGMGLPQPLALAYLVGLCELVGGICVLIGFQVRIVGVLLALFCLLTAYVAHMSDAIILMKNVALAGGYLVLAGSGAGAYAVDRKARVSAYA